MFCSACWLLHLGNLLVLPADITKVSHPKSMAAIFYESLPSFACQGLPLAMLACGGYHVYLETVVLVSQ